MTATSYHPTAPTTQRELSDYEQINAAQDRRVLNYLVSYYAGEYTAEEIGAVLSIDKHDIRRALTDLTKAGKIMRTGWKVSPSTGRRNGLYRAVV
jgi:predicted transcriptional regulator